MTRCCGLLGIGCQDQYCATVYHTQSLNQLSITARTAIRQYNTRRANKFLGDLTHHFICWVSPGHLPMNYPFHSIKCASQYKNEFDIIVQRRGSSLFDKYNDIWLNIIGWYAGLVPVWLHTITPTNADLSTTELLATKKMEIFFIGKIHLFQIAPLRSIPFVYLNVTLWQLMAI